MDDKIRFFRWNVIINVCMALSINTTLRGEKTPDGRWTASRILSAALSEYFEKHSEEIKQAKSVQNIVNFR